MGRTKVSATKTSGKRQSTIGRGESSQVRRKEVKHSDAQEDPTKFQNMIFWAERGFVLQKAPDAFTSVVKALGWEQLVQHPSSFFSAVVKEFYEGIAPPKDGKLQLFSKVRGVPVKFDSR